MHGTVTIDEAAEEFGVTTSTVRSWVSRGRIAPVRPGAKPLRFLEWDVARCQHDRLSEADHAALDSLWQELLALEQQKCNDSA